MVDRHWDDDHAVMSPQDDTVMAHQDQYELNKVGPDPNEEEIYGSPINGNSIHAPMRMEDGGQVAHHNAESRHYWSQY